MLQNEVSEQKIRSTVNEILKRKEFHISRRESPIAELIKRIWESIREWAENLLRARQPAREFNTGPDLLSPGFQTALKVFLAIAAAVLLFILVRLFIKKVYLPGRLKKEQAPKVADYLDNPGAAMDEFNRLLERKEFTAALRYLFISVLLELHKQKIIRIEKWKTNRIYIREIGSNAGELLTAMNEFSTLFNSCCYGHGAVDEAGISMWFTFFNELREKQT